MFHKKDHRRNANMLTGPFRRKGYDWWWHSFTAVHEKSGKEKAFFIEFFICNPALGGKDPVFGQLKENQEKGIKPSYLMVKAGCWGEDALQLHRFFGWNDVSISKKTPYWVQADNCYASENLLRGSICLSQEESEKHPEYMCDYGEISWDLTIDKQVAFNVGYGAGSFFRFLKAFEMYWHAEGMKSAYSGEIILNGEKYLVKPETSYGYADKNWGSNFTSPWVWLSSNHMTSRLTGEKLENSVFDIGGGCPKIYFFALKRKLLSAFLYEGKPYEFNFSKFWTFTRTRFSCWETEDYICWHVRQSNLHALMDTKIKCKKSDMLLVNYESPDGKKRHNRLWNGGNGFGIVTLYKRKIFGLSLVDEIDVTHVGCEYGEYEN